MSVGFGDDFKEQVRAATNIYDLVSETVNLIPNGRDYKGLCPFHDDKNPSFNVYPDRQTYRCWVCDKGGDCFTWVQEIQFTTFPEALEILAERGNIEIPKRAQSEFAKKSQDSKVTQHEIVEWAITLMQQALRMGEAGKLAREYAKKRNLSEDTARKFRLGYHPENWSWILDKAQGRFTEKQLLSVGLVGERDNGRGYYDNLVGRFVFPIIDERGRPVAFGGRVLPGSNIESPAKYWNSPESNIFLKRKTVYAFEQARDAIRTSKTAIIVEGYMDCIACHQAGVTNVVATLGTALTEDHVKFLKRFAVERVVLIYDGDQAGKDAAERSIGRFLAQDLDLRVLTLEEGQDPADYLENHGKEEFEALIGTAPEAWEYKLLTVTTRYGIDSVSGRQQVMNQLMDFLAAAPGLEGTLREDLILRKVCQRVQADEVTVRRQLQELRGKKTTRRFIRQDQPAQPEPLNLKFNGGDLAERELLEIILSCPEYADYIRHQIGPDDFNNTKHRQLLELCFDLVTEEGILPDARSVIAAAESDSAILSLVNALLDTASEKGIMELMREQPLTNETGGTSVPPHLERVLHPLLLRRAKNQNMLSKQKLAQADSSSSRLNTDTMDALRRIFRFRQSQMGDDPPSLK